MVPFQKRDDIMEPIKLTGLPTKYAVLLVIALVVVPVFNFVMLGYFVIIALVNNEPILAMIVFGFIIFLVILIRFLRRCLPDQLIISERGFEVSKHVIPFIIYRTSFIEHEKVDRCKIELDGITVYHSSNRKMKYTFWFDDDRRIPEMVEFLKQMDMELEFVPRALEKQIKDGKLKDEIG